MGAGSGHAIKMAAIGRELAALGHHPVFAGQQIGSLPPGCEVWQAPLWPGQLTAFARRPVLTPATMGDILVGLGLAEPGALDAAIGAWGRLIDTIRPDVIAAEFAPGLMAAAFGRVPMIGLGSGFSLPPAHLERFPSLTDRPAIHAEPPLLEAFNRAFASFGLPQRESLPGLFHADRELVSVFAELDPYRPWRQSKPGAPSAFLVDAMAGADGDEVFVYFNGVERPPLPFWRGLVDSGLKIRLFDPRLPFEDRAVLARAGMIVEERPVSFGMIAARSRLVVSHGGLGFACSALLAGLPQIVTPYDVEKRLIAGGLEALGVGRGLAHSAMEAGAVAEMLRATFEDANLSARARAAAPGFRARFRKDGHREIAEAIDMMTR